MYSGHSQATDGTFNPDGAPPCHRTLTPLSLPPSSSSSEPGT